MTDIDDLLATARSRRIDFKQGAHLLPRDMVLIVKLEAALRDARAEVERLQALVTDVAQADPNRPPGRSNYPWCHFCGITFGDGHGEFCVWMRARAVSPTPTEEQPDYGGNISPNHDRWERYQGSPTPIEDDDG